MELLFVPPDSVNLYDAGHRPELRLDDPVLDSPEIGLGIGLTRWLARVGQRFNDVHVDFTEAGRNRAHRYLSACRQLVSGLLDALVDELAREVNVRSVLEYDGDLAEPVARQRACVVELGQAAHRRFQRKGDALLDLQR